MGAGVSCKAEGGDTLVLRANAPQAALMHFGGLVVPVRAKVLTIPLTREAARCGSPRRFPRPLFVLPARAGRRGGLAERVGKRGKVVLHYLFAASVKVPARPWVGFSRATVDDVGRVIEAKAAAALADLGGTGSAS
jgi:phage gpG-like protein